MNGANSFNSVTNQELIKARLKAKDNWQEFVLQEVQKALELEFA